MTCFLGNGNQELKAGPLESAGPTEGKTLPLHYSPYHESPNLVKVSRAFFSKSLPAYGLTFVASELRN
jgi:hypothetical protein